MRRELVTAHVLQASMTTKPATAIRMTLITTLASSSPTAIRNPERRLGAPALVAYPRVGRVDGAGKPRVVGTKRLLDLLELAPLAQLGVPARLGTQAAQQTHLPLPHIQRQRTKQAHEPLAGS
jgi:hypothetical protein